MPSPRATIVYVSCADDKAIAVLAMDPATGALHEQARVPIPGTEVPSSSSLPMALSPDRRFLYAGLRTEPFPVSSFAIDPATGALTHVGMARLADTMCYLSTDMTGRFLFSASYHGSRIGVSPIVGGIVQDSVQVVETPPKAHSVVVAPDNRFVYAASLGGDVVLRMAFDASNGRLGVPEIAARVASGAGPRHFRITDDGQSLYLINELAGSINFYARDPQSGALTERQSLTMLAAPLEGSAAAADIHLTPNGRFLYGSGRKTNILSGFRIDAATGMLSAIEIVPSEPTPRGFAIEPSGRFLFCAGMTAGTVATYTIQATGHLTRSSVVPVGEGPNWIEILTLA